eukprot:TRINITY_DN3886_c0_g1_i1.p1 TRINITY_DN3886_c0_g1~~TRINITY_DN3886_c0_g1_i1.p1  ORF type:complete len:677 (-),score=108.94 TRINITY_DN3886_c0_g1_i1:91-2121(-)
MVHVGQREGQLLQRRRSKRNGQQRYAGKRLPGTLGEQPDILSTAALETQLDSAGTNGAVSHRTFFFLFVSDKQMACAGWFLCPSPCLQCGILCFVGDPNPELEAALELVQRRGPDASNRLLIPTPAGPLHLCAATLFLRGDVPTPQPLQDAAGNVLLWNGEIYSSTTVTVQPHESDTAALMRVLSAAVVGLDGIGAAKQVAQVLSGVHGEFAWAFWHSPSCTLLFGRDDCGRRSLLQLAFPRTGVSFALASVVPLQQAGTAATMPTTHQSSKAETPGGDDGDGAEDTDAQWETDWIEILPGSYSVSLAQPGTTQPLPVQTIENWATPLRNPEEFEMAPRDVEQQLSKLLDEAVGRRVTCIPPPVSPNAARLAVLFSGGLDSTVLAALAHNHVPLAEPIDLLNVAFSGRSPAAAAYHAAAAAAAAQSGPRHQRGSRGPVEPAVPFDTPDRRTAIASWQQLQRTYPGRLWRLILVNIEADELQRTLPHVAALVYPRLSTMDANIGAAFWFASRGKGVLPSGEVCESSARVLLVGCGADEQMAGYGRHATAWRRGAPNGEAVLTAELNLDMSRLWQRNLGRDDRIISDHGKEGRYPFLDETVRAAIARLPLKVICDLRLPRGQGDKMVLRRIARDILGLERSAEFPKRAVQFGSHVVKVTHAGPCSAKSGTSRFVVPNS